MNLIKGGSYVVTVTKDDSGRKLITFPHNPLPVDKVKTIHSHKWHPAEKDINIKTLEKWGIMIP